MSSHGSTLDGASGNADPHVTTPVSNKSPTILAVLQQYHMLAQESLKRSLLIKDPACISFLVYVLDEEDGDVVKTALETLLLFCTEFRHRPIIKSTYGITVALDIVLKNSRHSQKIHELAEDLKTILEKTLVPMRDSKNTSAAAQSSRRKSSVHRSFAASNKAKPVILQLSMPPSKVLQWADYRLRCEAALIRIKGVVSITFDSLRRRCICRVKDSVDPQILVHALNGTGMLTAEILTKEEAEAIEKRPVPESQEAADRSKGPPDSGRQKLAPTLENVSGYLNEDDSPVREFTVRKPPPRQEQNNGWIKTVGSFLQRSFYW